MTPEFVDVLVVGGGPTGLAVANALGMRGLDVALIEQDPGVAELPRAVSIDDETMRFMHDIGLLEQVRRVTVPGTGTKFFGARWQLLAYGRGPVPPPYGHPVKNPMDHSEFQQVLLDGLGRFPNVAVSHETCLRSFTQEVDQIVAQVEHANG